MDHLLPLLKKVLKNVRYLFCLCFPRLASSDNLEPRFLKEEEEEEESSEEEEEQLTPEELGNHFWNRIVLIL